METNSFDDRSNMPVLPPATNVNVAKDAYLMSQSERLSLVKSGTKQKSSISVKSNLDNQTGHSSHRLTQNEEIYKKKISHIDNDNNDNRDERYTLVDDLHEEHEAAAQTQAVKKTVLEEHGFTIGKQIGSGTYAKVKIAYSSEFKGPVAVKIISKIKAPHEYLTKFLPREIDVVRGLRHENLIRFYQSIETTHRVYIIMQLAEKGSLLDLIRQSGYLSDSSARKYCRQLSSAIEYCHSQGVVHRDIKCENLLLDKEWNLKVIDFGFARKNMTTSNSKEVLSETYCGSYAYASPEVLKGQPYDPHMSDIWAIGVVLFAMVFGRLPFDGSNYNQLLKQVQSKLIFPRTPNVVPTCKTLLTKILAPLKVRLTIKQLKQDPWYAQVT